MAKEILDLFVAENAIACDNCFLLKLGADAPLPEMLPGQFVEVLVEAQNVFLRRPISVNYIDAERNELWLLIQIVGKGTKALSSLKKGDQVDLVAPLGNAFTIPGDKNSKCLLVGGGVGVAPLLFLGRKMKDAGLNPSFLLGGRSCGSIAELPLFEQIGSLHITTEDGSLGEKGYVTDHSVWEQETFTHIYTCGPQVMMQNVAKMARRKQAQCEVSLENRMACGIGACLCCVENTANGNVCTCKDGPVFNIDKLLWQI